MMSAVGRCVDRSFTTQLEDTGLVFPFVVVHKDSTLTDLAIEYARTHDLKVRDVLAERAQGLVRRIAWKAYVPNGSRGDVDDMTQDGNEGLLDAMENYDPGRGVKFETYAGSRIRGAILDGLRRDDSLTRLERAKVTILERINDSLIDKIGEVPSYEELKEDWERQGGNGEFNFVYDLLRRGRKFISIFSYVQKVYENLRVCDTLRGNEGSVLDEVMGRELLDLFELDLQALPERDREIMRQIVFDDEMNQADIAEEHGVCKMTVTNIRDRYLNDPEYFRRTREYLVA